MPAINKAANTIKEQALYGEVPIIPFLGCWLGPDADNGEAYHLARPYLSDKEHRAFDLEHIGHVHQRTFMLLVALSEGATV